MVGDWSGLLVTSASPLPLKLVEALLRTGVKAVVAPEPYRRRTRPVAAVSTVRSLSQTALLSGDADAPADPCAPGLAASGFRSEDLDPSLMVRVMGSFSSLEAVAGDPSHQLSVQHLRGGSMTSVQSTWAVTDAAAGGAVRGRASETPRDDAVLAFFAAFYEELFAGEDVVGAIQAGEAAAPEIEGLFVCFHL